MPAPTNGLVLFYNMETLTGVQIKDLSSQTNHGTIIGAGDTSGKIARARSFDGTDDEIDVPDNTILDFGLTTDSYSVACWASFTSQTADRYLIQKSRSPNTRQPLSIPSNTLTTPGQSLRK